MKKQGKMLMAALLAGVLLSACGGTAAGSGSGAGSTGAEKAAGRYVESDVTPKGESSGWHLFRQTEEKLVCYDSGFKNRYESTDGGQNWQQSPGPGAADARFDGIRQAALLEDGSLIAELPFQNEDGSRGGGPSEIVKVSPGGEVNPMELEGYSQLAAEGKNVFVSGMQALPGGRLLLHYYQYDFVAGAGSRLEPEAGDSEGPTGTAPDSGSADAASQPREESAPASQPAASGAEAGSEGEEESGAETGGAVDQFFSGLYDSATGKRVADLTEAAELAATASGDTLYLLGYSGSISARKLSDGSAGEDFATKAALGDEMNMNVGLDALDGKLYLADAKGLTELADEAKKLTDSAGYAFGAPGTRINSLLALADGSFLMSLSSAGKASIKRYTFDPTAKADTEKSLRLWMLRENPVLRAAISEFIGQNPGTSVEVEVAITEDNGVTAEDAIKALNTQMLAGDGPDLLVLDGCPMERYAGGGLLYNLADTIDTSGMEEALRSPFVGEDACYYLPLRWKPPVLLGQREALAQAESLEAILELTRAGKAPPEMNPETDDVFAGIPEEERPVLDFSSVREVYDLLWNSSAPALFPEGTLDTEALAKFFEALKTFTDKGGLTRYGEEGRPDGIMGMSTDDGGSMVTLEGSVLRYVSQQSLYGGFTAEDLQMLGFMDEREDSGLGLFPGLAKGCWLPASLLAINAASGKTELATAFIQCALSPACQGQRVGGGLPVTAEGTRAQMDALQTLRGEGDDGGAELGIDFAPALAAATQPMLVDDALREMVYTAANAYCKGELNLEEATAQTQKDSSAYLAERQN